MTRDEKSKFALWIVFAGPILGWYLAVKYTETLTTPKFKHLFELAVSTTPFDKPVLFYSLILGLVASFLICYVFNKLVETDPFTGVPFKKFFRGAKLVSAKRLASMTKDSKQEQIKISNVPIPITAEQRHLLVSGATGSGKSVTFKQIAFEAMMRGDRAVIIDPNGDMLSKFYKEGDHILNPFDTRTEPWSFYNEIRSDYDYDRYTLSFIPRGSTSEIEEWRSYARILFAATARKIAMTGKRPGIREISYWTNKADPDELKKFLAGTNAETLFVGADKALASARFVLSSIYPAHLDMPEGPFSIRKWLEDKEGGNLYITWREDMTAKLRPLISAWVDVICTTVLSIPESNSYRLWLFIDELASLEKLPSLEAALTKGRKSGLRIVAGLQAVSQLESIYGKVDSQTLRSCFRSLIVFSCSNTDPNTCDEMSKALGEHEVEREKESHSSGSHKSKNKSPERSRERLVLPSEIANLPDLTGYLAITGDYPIAKIKQEVINFKERVPAFVEKSFGE